MGPIARRVPRAENGAADDGGRSPRGAALRAFLGVLLWGLPLCAGAAPPAWAGAAATGKNPIDVRYERMLAQDSSTSGMVRAASEATKAWDEELNRVYGMLMKELDPEARSALREAQRAWIRYRDAELRAVDAIVEDHSERSGGGTIWAVVRAGRVMELTRSRALTLSGYRDEGDWAEE